jgi:peptidoglycan L-alanyl-D-glutamate endopeptidase CwlK
MKQDSVTLKRIDLLHPNLRNEVKTMYEEICEALTGRAVCRFSHTLRTDKEQDDLYAQGRTKPGKKVTNAKGGQSYHNYGLAFDIVLIIDGKEASWDTLKDFDGDKVADWHEVVRIAKKYGWAWGGDFVSFKDAPHFEKTFGKKTSELKALRKGNLYPIL